MQYSLSKLSGFTFKAIKTIGILFFIWMTFFWTANYYTFNNPARTEIDIQEKRDLNNPGNISII